MSDLELKDALWTSPRSDLALGDVCIAPHPAMPSDPDLIVLPDSDEQAVLTVTVGYALVVGAFNHSVSYVPVATHLDLHPALLEQFAERALDVSGLLRVPPLEGEWDQPAVALLRMPQTINPRFFAGQPRLASMDDEAAALLRQRFQAAFTPDG